MRLTVAIDNRFLVKDGVLHDTYTQDHAFWQDYLEVFDEVVVVGRAREVDALPPGARRSSGPRVSFAPLPFWEGISGWLRARAAVRAELRRLADHTEAALLRVPGLVGHEFAALLRARGVPYAVEVVEDPRGGRPARDVLGNVAQARVAAGLRATCAGAAAASYVTAHTLQRAYPAPQAAVRGSYSSLRLPEALIRGTPRRWDAAPQPLRVAHVGAMMHPRKGQELLLRAMAHVARAPEAPALVCTFAGDGPLRAGYEALARDLGVAERCTFLGHVPRDLVVGPGGLLDHSDLLVLPSRGEGLPRAVLEAMARGVPVLATPVSGTPEVLPADALVPPRTRAIAARLAEVACDPGWLSERSARGLETAREFREPLLLARRIGFYAAYRRLLETGRAPLGAGDEPGARARAPPLLEGTA